MHSLDIQKDWSHSVWFDKLYYFITWCIRLSHFEEGVNPKFCGCLNSLPGQSMWDLWGTMWNQDMFFSESFSFPLSISFHWCSIFTLVSSGGWKMCLLAARVQQTHSLTHTNNNKKSDKARHSHKLTTWVGKPLQVQGHGSGCSVQMV